MGTRQKFFVTLAAAVVIVIATSASASVMFVSGEVMGTWDADSIIVTDTVMVAPRATLTIEPGVNVYFLGYYKFYVAEGAALHAVGTEQEPIEFVPFSDGDRSLGLDFINASSSSVLEHVHIANALSSGIHLDNSSITVRNSVIEDNEAPSGVNGGGAIEILNGSDALIENNMIVNNHSVDYGGGIYIEDSSPVITGNTIMNNLAGWGGNAGGGGIAVFGESNPEITYNEISNNTVSPVGSFSIRRGYGGGIYYAGASNGLIANNNISGNFVNWEPQTETFGGGIYIFGASPMIDNNTIVHNEAESNDGGGVYMYNSNSVFTNNTISYNTAGDFGGAVFSKFSDPTFINSILYFNQDSTGSEIWAENSDVQVRYSDIQGGWQGIGNMDSDPLFRDPQNGDFHLMSTECGDEYNSPAIDTGDPAIIDAYLGCLGGLGTELSDMGAFGGQGSPTTDITDPGDIALPDDFTLAQNYPNPFNATTSIEYNLGKDSHVVIDIFDTLGRKITTLVDSDRPAGSYSAVWDASSQATGIYFYRITVDGSSAARKMSLLK